MKSITTLHVIELPNGRFGYAGKVPASIGYIDASPEKIELGARFGQRFGPKTRSFETREQAKVFAKKNGFKVS